MKQTQNSKKAVVAFSGGLDTSFCVVYLIDQGYTVATVTVDSGGFSSDELQRIAETSKKLGAVEHEAIDAKEEIYNRFVTYIIKGNILRGGVYPLCVGAERSVQAEKLVHFAKAKGAAVVCHGCTGAGNDQVRFDVAIQALNSELKILAPIRELEISREEEISYLLEHGIEVPATKKKYSINQGILGTTIGGGETHQSWSVPPQSVYGMTKSKDDAPLAPEELIISFKEGLPVALNQKPMAGYQILMALNTIGGKHGIGRGIHLGDTILGIKGRIAFEAPGAMILINAHRELEKLVLTKWQAYMKESVTQFYGMRLHEGGWYDPGMRDIEALINSSQKTVTGDVKVLLHKGVLEVQGCRSEYSLMDVGATYGEGSGLWSGDDAKGFSKLVGLQTMLAHRRVQCPPN